MADSNHMPGFEAVHCTTAILLAEHAPSDAAFT